MVLDTKRKINVCNGVVTLGYGEKVLTLEDGKVFVNGDKVLQKDLGKDLYIKLKKLGVLVK